MAEIRARNLALKSLLARAECYASGNALLDIPTARRIVDNLWDRFAAAHASVLNLVTDDDDDGTHDAVQMQAEGALMKCMSVLREKSVSPAPTGATYPEPAPVKLAHITMQSFTGDCMTWMEFRDQFTALVHNHPTMDAHAKLAYLRKHAQVDMVTGPYGGNYEDLWEKLCSRYNDYHMLAREWHHRYMRLPRAKDTRDGLQKLVDETRAYIRAQAVLGYERSGEAPVYYMLFWDKLPESAQFAFGLSRTDMSIPSLEECIRFIENRFKILPSEPASSSHGRDTKVRAHVGRAQSRSQCACAQNHRRFAACPEFGNMTISQRTRFITEQKRCTNCFGAHAAAECRSTYTCNRCSEAHHSLLCPHPDARGAPTSSQPQNVPRH